MGLFDMIKNVGEMAGDAAQLDDVIAEIGKILKSAHAEGKVDDKVWNSFEALDRAELAEKLQMAEKFADILETHMDKLPADLKPAAKKLNNALSLLDKAQDLLGGK